MKSTPLHLSGTQKVAQKVMTKLSERQNPHALVVGLIGDLGAGKTTFMQFFGRELGVREKILSPTFVIEKIYKISHPKFDHLIHIDAYRIENPKELLNLGWEEIVKNPRNIICIEWADKIKTLLPEDYIPIKFSHHGEETRIISVENGHDN